MAKHALKERATVLSVFPGVITPTPYSPMEMQPFPADATVFWLSTKYQDRSVL